MAKPKSDLKRVRQISTIHALKLLAEQQKLAEASTATREAEEAFRTAEMAMEEAEQDWRALLNEAAFYPDAAQRAAYSLNQRRASCDAQRSDLTRRQTQEEAQKARVTEAKGRNEASEQREKAEVRLQARRADEAAEIATSERASFQWWRS